MSEPKIAASVSYTLGGSDADAAKYPNRHAMIYLRQELDACRAELARSRSKPRWIPVSERLPEPGVSVLIFFRPLDDDGTPSCIGCDGKGGLITVAAVDRIDRQYLWTSEYGDETPTHWMPLPEPPAE